MGKLTYSRFSLRRHASPNNSFQISAPARTDLLGLWGNSWGGFSTNQLLGMGDELSRTDFRLDYIFPLSERLSLLVT